MRKSFHELPGALATCKGGIFLCVEASEKGSKRHFPYMLPYLSREPGQIEVALFNHAGNSAGGGLLVVFGNHGNGNYLIGAEFLDVEGVERTAQLAVSVE